MSGEVQPKPRTAVLSISTSRSVGGDADDLSGEELVRFAEGLGAEVVSQELIPDSQNVIEERLRKLADVERCDLILTTGGTGFAPDDVTPEATLESASGWRQGWRRRCASPPANTPRTGCSPATAPASGARR
jgi:molybdenum cofactor synthesis domain-containing protein